MRQDYRGEDSLSPMITIPIQQNTPGALVDETSFAASNAMPFGLTFALQSVRTGHTGTHLAEMLSLKETALEQKNATGRSRVEWGIHRV